MDLSNYRTTELRICNETKSRKSVIIGAESLALQVIYLASPSFSTFLASLVATEKGMARATLGGAEVEG